MTLDLDPGLLEAQLRELALEARAHRFEVAPNPCVGAGILSGGRLVARGFHEHWGGAHAELQALREADRLGIPLAERDALLVTLEPCSSFGKTPPCTEAVIEAGLRRVVVGATDPDPRHRGQGLERLRGAGVEVVELPAGSPLEETSPHFLRWTSPARTRSRRPWVVAKWAQTMTGQLVPPPEVGEGRWISGPEALEAMRTPRDQPAAPERGLVVWRRMVCGRCLLCCRCFRSGPRRVRGPIGMVRLGAPADFDQCSISQPRRRAIAASLVSALTATGKPTASSIGRSEVESA